MRVTDIPDPCVARAVRALARAIPRRPSPARRAENTVEAVLRRLDGKRTAQTPEGGRGTREAITRTQLGTSCAQRAHARLHDL